MEQEQINLIINIHENSQHQKHIEFSIDNKVMALNCQTELLALTKYNLLFSIKDFYYITNDLLTKRKCQNLYQNQRQKSKAEWFGFQRDPSLKFKEFDFFIISNRIEHFMKISKKEQKTLALFFKAQLDLIDSKKPKIISYADVLENF